MSNLILIRGLPGSGKTTKALEYKKQGYKHYEADQYFIDPDGKYIFNPNLIIDAQDWCKTMVKLAMLEEKNIVVSNTFTQMWQLDPYIVMGIKNGYNIKIIEMRGTYGSIYNLPLESMERMKRNWRELKPEYKVYLNA